MADRNPVQGQIKGKFTAEEIKLNEADRDRRDYTAEQVIEYRRGVARVRREGGES